MRSIDKPFLYIVLALTIFGFLIFLSASLGLLARDGGVSFGSAAVSQALFGLFLGLAFFFIAANTHYRFWKRHAPWIFIGSLVLTALVFVPNIGFEHAGANRWIDLKIVTFQPAEALKVGVVIYLAALFAMLKNKVRTLRSGLVPFLAVLAPALGLLLAQPDTGTAVVIGATALALFLIAGAQKKHAVFVVLVALVLGSSLIFARPYLWDRISTFINPGADQLGAGWQLDQSLIAIGSGGLWGKGFGQSVQKFNYLPEPVGDSVFAVAAEEFGFVGSFLILALFLALLWRGLVIARRAPDIFSGLAVAGLVILVIVQSFINMAAMTGLFPLTGLPLLFVSQGGSALLMTLFAMGIVANISRYSRK